MDRSCLLSGRPPGTCWAQGRVRPHRIPTHSQEEKLASGGLAAKPSRRRTANCHPWKSVPVSHKKTRPLRPVRFLPSFHLSRYLWA